MARTLMLVPLNVSCQQVPQLAEFQPAMAGAPPISGKEGNDLNVVKPFVNRPFAPSEQATVARDWDALSYTGSYETETVAPSADGIARRAKRAVNFMLKLIGFSLGFFEICQVQF